MCRVVSLSFALMLAVGPDAALLCRTWCSAEVAAAIGCHHESPASSTNVAGTNSCDEAVLSTASFLQQEARRVVSDPDADHALLVPSYRLFRSTIAARPGQEAGREWSLEKRPLATVLRI